MRFLKEMIGRQPQPQDLAAMAAVHEPQEPEQYAEDFDEWDLPDDEVTSPAPAVAAVRRGTRRPAEAAADDALQGTDDVAEEHEPAPVSAEDEIADNVKIWELFDEDHPEDEADLDDDADEMIEQASDRSEADMAREAMALIKARSGGGEPALPAPDASAAQGGRAKTRLIGFAADESAGPDLFDTKRRAAAGAGPSMFPVGWIVVIDGPGRGASFPIVSGLSQIGRGEDQTIPLSFGDQSISRQNHASIAYDDEENAFYLGHGGKANIVRLNGKPVLSTEELSDADMIRIGETTLRFVALCGPDFAWDLTDDSGRA